MTAKLQRELIHNQNITAFVKDFFSFEVVFFSIITCTFTHNLD